MAIVFKNSTSEKLESPLLQSKKINIDKNGSTSKFTCYLGETNIAKLTDEQKEMATNKN